MANLILNGSTSGSVTLSSPAVSGTTTLTLPTTSGTVLTNGTNTNFPAGSVLQVLQTVKTDIFSTASTTMVDITGLSVSITPSSSSNQILVMFSGQISSANNVNSAGIQLSRGGSAIFIGDTAGNRVRATSMAYGDNIDTQYAGNFSYLDSPATTSSTTYAIQMRCNTAGTAYLNRSSADANTTTDFRTPASIIVMEIKG
jgi:hypothetical protein